MHEGRPPTLNESKAWLRRHTNPRNLRGRVQDALHVRSTEITESMKQAAARAIADCIAPRELSAEYIVPSVFNRQVIQRVAAAVQCAALQAGVARKRK